MIYLLPEIYQMRKNIRSPRRDLDRLRLNLLQKQIRNIYENVPFYRETFQRLNIVPDDFKTLNDLQKLPIITKEDIRNNGKKFFNEKINLKKCFHSFSSGSTGEPFKSYFDLKTWIRKKYLSKLRARFFCGMKPGEKIVILGAQSIETFERTNSKWYFQSLLPMVLFISIFEDIEEVFSKVNTFKPQNMYGPPSFFLKLAQIAEKKKVNCFYLKKIFTSSEYLEKSVAEYIRSAFQVEMYDIYGSVEFKEVAWECQNHNGYHINEDEVICEILMENKPVCEGELGNIVLTDLRNIAHPLIRYQIKDTGVLIKKKCDCGCSFSLMMPSGGRSTDYIQLPDGMRLTAYQLEDSIERIKGIIQYQIVQTNEKLIIVNIICRNFQNDTTSVQITKNLNVITKGLMQVKVRFQDSIAAEENGKFKTVKNCIKTPKSINSESRLPILRENQ